MTTATATELSNLTWEERPNGARVAHVQHGLTDEKGRTVGGYAAVYWVAHRYGQADQPGFWNLDIQATRDGKHYGASSRGTSHPSQQRAMAAAPAKLAAQRKAYERKYRVQTNERAAGVLGHAPTRPNPMPLTTRQQSDGMPCKYGHIGCSYTDGGPCSNETQCSECMAPFGEHAEGCALVYQQPSEEAQARQYAAEQAAVRADMAVPGSVPAPYTPIRPAEHSAGCAYNAPHWQGEPNSARGLDPQHCLRCANLVAAMDASLKAKLAGSPDPYRRDPREPRLHRHGDTVHAHAGREGFEIGGQVVADAYPDTDGHRHGTLGGRGKDMGPASVPAGVGGGSQANDHPIDDGADDGHLGLVTIAMLADHRLGREASTGADFQQAGLAMLGGCEICGATIAAYNAYPSHSGMWRCGDCIGDLGWDDVAAAERDIFAQRER